MTIDDFVKKYGIDGKPLYFVPMSFSLLNEDSVITIMNKPLGVFETHITKVEPNGCSGLTRVLLDTSKFSHLLRTERPEEYPVNYGCESSNDHFVCNTDIGYNHFRSSLKYERLFFKKEDAENYCIEKINSFYIQFESYVKKLKNQINKIEKHITLLVNEKEEIENLLDKYGAEFGVEHIISI